MKRTRICRWCGETFDRPRTAPPPVQACPAPACQRRQTVHRERLEREARSAARQLELETQAEQLAAALERGKRKLRYAETITNTRY